MKQSMFGAPFLPIKWAMGVIKLSDLFLKPSCGNFRLEHLFELN